MIDPMLLIPVIRGQCSVPIKNRPRVHIIPVPATEEIECENHGNGKMTDLRKDMIAKSSQKFKVIRSTLPCISGGYIPFGVDDWGFSGVSISDASIVSRMSPKLTD